MHQVVYNNKLEHKCTLTPLEPRLLYVGPYTLRDTCPLGDTCPDSYSRLSVLCVLCVLYLAACLAAICTMQCRAASNAHYAVLGSFQRVLLSFSRSIHRIYTISRLYLLKLYSIAIYLGHRTNILDFIPITLRYHNFFNIYPIDTK